MFGKGAIRWDFLNVKRFVGQSKRRVFIACAKIVIDMHLFLTQELFNRSGEFLIFNPMQASCFDWSKTACNFMFTLSSGIKASDPLFDRILNPLVKTGLEVQTIDLV